MSQKNWREVHTFRWFHKDGYKLLCQNPDDFVSNTWILFDPLGVDIGTTSTRLKRKDPETVVPQVPFDWAEKEIKKHDEEMKRLEAEMREKEKTLAQEDA